MRLALLIGAAALVVGAAALALVHVEIVPAAESGEAGEDRTREGAPADHPQPLPRE